MEPHRLVYTGRRWYLLAWDRDREDWRTFRADRIQPRLPTGPRFTPREPPEDAAQPRRPRRRLVGVEAPGPDPLPRARRGHRGALPPEAGLLRPDGEHSCVLETGSDSLRDLVRYLTSLDIAFEVLDPPELRTLLRELADRYAAAAGDPSPAAGD